jgi:hypothetical protein
MLRRRALRRGVPWCRRIISALLLLLPRQLRV